MSPELIRAALVFLQRVDIKGGEAMVMVQVCQALDAMMQPRRFNGVMQQDAPPAQVGVEQ